MPLMLAMDRLRQSNYGIPQPPVGSLSMHGKFGMDEKVPPKEEEAIRFAKVVAEALRHDVGEFDRLYVIAAPHFLGLLRPDLEQSVAAKVAGEIDKDLSRRTAEDFRAYLPARVWAEIPGRSTR